MSRFSRASDILSIAAGIMMMANAVSPQAESQAPPILGSYSNRHHGWGGKRRKLKGYKLDHQRPHRGRRCR